MDAITIVGMAKNIHRMSEEELPGVLELLAKGGGTARTVESWRQDRMTALIYGAGGEMTAVMPMSRRTIEVSPGRALAAGWLSSNQFAARMSLRRHTKETAREWAELLPELDALVVVRRDEGSLAARWYAQAGFQDVMAIRCLYLDMEAPPGGMGSSGAGRYQVEVVSVGGDGTSWDAARWQPEMLGVYRDVYGACGGAVVRDANFWPGALAHHYYRQHYQFQIVGLWSGATAEGGGMLMGYAVIGWSGWHSKRPRMDILELATRQWDTGVANELLRTTCQLAWSKNVREVRAVISVHDPYRGHLARYGFEDRWGYVMQAKWLRAQRYLDRVAEGLPMEISGEGGDGAGIGGAGGGAIDVAGGEERRAGGGRRLEVTRGCAGDDAVVAAAVGWAGGDARRRRSGWCALFARGVPTPTDETRLSLVFPWTPWVFHMLDYISANPGGWRVRLRDGEGPHL